MKLRWIPMLLLLLLLSAVPARAAGVLHAAYLAGYPDGTIRPEAPVTRAQLAVILFRLAEHVPEQTDADMPDVPPEHWAHGAAALVCRTEVMNLQPDGLFHPEQTVTGPELACALNRLTTHDHQHQFFRMMQKYIEIGQVLHPCGS